MNTTVNVNISAENMSASRVAQTQTTAPDDTIKAEARRRIEAEAAKARAEAEAARIKAAKEAEEAEARIREERIRLRAEEERVQIEARRLVLEGEAKRIAAEKEAAIQAEMERLKNRSATEILEDKVAELTALVQTLQSRRCF